jgi:hypothetical protein
MYKVEGYEFETQEQALAARQEAEQVSYLKQQTGKDDPDVVLTLYNRLVERGTFSTKVGLGYLMELREYLNAVPYIKDEDILPLPVGQTPKAGQKDAKQAAKPAKKQPTPQEEEQAELRQRQRQQDSLLRQQIRSKNHYRRLFHISTFFAVVFALAVVGMLAITVVSKDNVTIVNYENSLIDKYESWEQELNEREAQLELREQQLNMQEEQD